MSQPMSAVVDELRQGLAIRTRWPVSDISYDQGGAVLTGPDGVRLGGRKVIVTASLAVLQSGRLGFSPSLPADKQGALRRLRMGNAAKVRGSTCAGRLGEGVVLFRGRSWQQAGGHWWQVQAAVLQVTAQCGTIGISCRFVLVVSQNTGMGHPVCLLLVVPAAVVLQIIIAFDKRIWPAQLYDVVCTHSFVPELWMTQHDVIDSSSKHLHAVVGKFWVCVFAPATPCFKQW